MNRSDDEKQMLEKIFLRIVDEEAFAEPELERRKHDFVFHFQDCIDELLPFAQSVTTLPGRDVEEAWRTVYDFFIHALNHLEAARDCAMPDHENPFDSVDTATDHR